MPPLPPSSRMVPHDGRGQHDAGHVGLQHQQRQHQQQRQQRDDELPHQALVEPLTLGGTRRLEPGSSFSSRGALAARWAVSRIISNLAISDTCTGKAAERRSSGGSR